MSINKTNFFTTTEGVYVNYKGVLPEPNTTLVLAISMEQKDEARLGKPRLFEDVNPENPKKILLSNGDYFTYLTFEQTKDLEFIDGKYLVVHPEIVPTLSMLKNKPKGKLEEEF
jgi:hypothetical protein